MPVLMKQSAIPKWWVLIPFLLCLNACSEESGQPRGPAYSTTPQSLQQPTYRLAIHPLHNPRKLSEAYQPLIDYLNEHMQGMHFELEASRDYQAYEAKFRKARPELLLPNPWQTLEAIKVGYRVIAMAGNAEDFKGIFIVRKDAGINKPLDLKGKVVSYPSHTALAACIMPQNFLHTHGLDINKDIENRYVGSQESSIMNAYMGESAAGATWPPPWRLFQRDRPREAAELKVIWTTPPLLNNSVMVRRDIPPGISNQLQKLLLELNHSTEGMAILKRMETARFHAADNASYQQVREYIRQFEKDVRKVEDAVKGQ
jgi:phosphonate transport system substrate-binding protein